MTTTNSFFDESKEQSLVKTTIVAKYFWAWANVIVGVQKRTGRGDRIAYIDLFAGPGRYKDGSKSTPLRILEQAIDNDELRKRLVSIFNDVDERNSNSLIEAIAEIPGIETLRFPPKVDSKSVGSEIVQFFESMRLVPTLFFVDPWGYKGLSLRLVNSVLKDWGCDCIFFFNYNRINMGLGNEFVAASMNELFGEERADNLRKRLEGISPTDREFAVVEELAAALKSMGGEFVLPFCFKNDVGTRTSHHLIFVSKNFLGYEIMKDIMAKESSTLEQGVPSLQYCPADKRFPLLFELNRPLDELQDLLVARFSGRTLTMDEVYQEHNVGTRFIKKNYKDALKALEELGRIRADPPAVAQRGEKNRPRGTFADHVIVTFPDLTHG